MAIWFLILWNLAVPPFEGGQYQTREGCLAAVRAQYIPLTKVYGHLYWKCEVRMVIGRASRGKEAMIRPIKLPFSPRPLASSEDSPSRMQSPNGDGEHELYL